MIGTTCRCFWNKRRRGGEGNRDATTLSGEFIPRIQSGQNEKQSQ